MLLIILCGLLPAFGARRALLRSVSLQARVSIGFQSSSMIGRAPGHPASTDPGLGLAPQTILSKHLPAFELLPAPASSRIPTGARTDYGEERGKVYRVAVVHASTPVAEMAQDGNPRWRAFFAELGRLGYVEGKNLIVERRTGRQAVAGVIPFRPDVIVAVGIGSEYLKAATKTVPIVTLIQGDPVARGLMASLSRPGGNITGFGLDAGDDIVAKQLELLLEVVPAASRVGYLDSRSDHDKSPYARAIRRANERVGRTLVFGLIDEPIQEAQYSRAFDRIVAERAQALIVPVTPEHFTNRHIIIEFARRNRLPTIYPWREYAEIGGLMSYGTDLVDLWRQMAGYVDRILKGTSPRDLPVQLPTKFELVINLKTAKALGLTIPQSLLLRADQVIE
jgi:putative tryptophan/tyrosine transport system substrate-binding protein